MIPYSALFGKGKRRSFSDLFDEKFFVKSQSFETSGFVIY
jgi:hypothetical protein